MEVERVLSVQNSSTWGRVSPLTVRAHSKTRWTLTFPHPLRPIPVPGPPSGDGLGATSNPGCGHGAAGGGGAWDTCRLSSVLLSPADRGWQETAHLIWQGGNPSLPGTGSPGTPRGAAVISEGPRPHRGRSAEQTRVLDLGRRCTQPAFPTPNTLPLPGGLGLLIPKGTSS